MIKALLVSLLISAPEAARAACDRLAVIAPPPVDDMRLADWLANEAGRQLLAKDKKRCWSIRRFQSTTALFDMLGSTTGFPRSPETFGRRQLAWLVQKTGATHVLFVDAPVAAGPTYARLFAIRKGEALSPEQAFPVPVDAKAVAAHASGAIPRFLAKIAPNSVVAGYTTTTAYFEVDEHRYGERSIETRGLLPPLISSFAASRVDHRRGFGLFDATGSIFPGQYFFGIDQDNSYKQKPGLADAAHFPDDLKVHIETYGACGSANAEASFFTPIGTTYVGIGWGPCLLWLEAKGRDALWYMKSATRYFFGHRVFVNDRMFLALDWDSLVFNQELVKTRYAKAYQVERVGLSVGWYVQDSERLAASLWNAIF